MSKQSSSTEEDATSHLDDVEDGCGCVELWELTSERRNRDGEEQS
jgi:hypothetical protein